MQAIRKKINWRLLIFFTMGMLSASFLFSNIASGAVTVSSVELIGKATLPKGLSFQKTEIGGLSGITYDASNDLYYVISDDGGQKAPARFYTFKIDLSKGKLEDKGVTPVGVTTLLDEDGKPFAVQSSDTEGIAVTQAQTVFISSEGNVGKLIPPFIKEFSLSSGKASKTLQIPQKFLPDKNRKQGIRNNLAFETLTITPNNQYLFTATENALIQDGPAAQPDIGSPCRILQYNLQTNQPEKEFLYPTKPVSTLFNLAGRFASGLPDLLALDNQGNFLSLERSFTGLGFGVSLFQVSLEGADNIQNIDSLLAVDTKNIKPVQKRLILDLRILGIALDNIEGLTFGPSLPNGQRTLILVSDNNFNSIQRNQIFALKLKLESPLIRIFRRILPNLNR